MLKKISVTKILGIVVFCGIGMAFLLCFGRGDATAVAPKNKKKAPSSQKAESFENYSSLQGIVSDVAKRVMKEEKKNWVFSHNEFFQSKIDPNGGPAIPGSGLATTSDIYPYFTQSHLSVSNKSSLSLLLNILSINREAFTFEIRKSRITCILPHIPSQMQQKKLQKFEQLLSAPEFSAMCSVRFKNKLLVRAFAFLFHKAKASILINIERQVLTDPNGSPTLPLSYWSNFQRVYANFDKVSIRSALQAMLLTTGCTMYKKGDVYFVTNRK